MKKMYHLEYQETEQTFADMYQMFYDDRSFYFYRLIVTIGGLLAFFIRLSIDRSTLSAAFLIKFAAMWALAYVIGYLLVKYVIRGIDEKSAEKAGKAKYRLRAEKCGPDLLMKLDFYEDKFTVCFQDKREEYSYKEITRLPASNKFYGMVVGGVYGKKEMLGFPAVALEKIDKDGFFQMIEEKSTNVAGGFKIK